MQPHRTSTIHDSRYRRIIDLLTQARKEKGLPLLELVQKLGFTQPDISKIETKVNIIEFLGFLEVISGKGSDFVNQTWKKINECRSQFKSSEYCSQVSNY